ncbi:PP2C family protein-serine/threonine phosphatase [Glycomyces buryatensis]|uniref:Serine/threonine-protein phosphatase n=1 Tax=Glycomyces buryatensis TaxID=2570927 RepID=A0A4S8QI54_9ACTN|nr:PP2C family serine/threonine-protein phosphatase [Glycomyces buryatensis]THV42665.1 serine/threonine-protein phosphatase [Glycomyces buryatensis]
MQPSTEAAQGSSKQCTACGLAADVGRYCEICGGDLEELALPAEAPAWISSAATEDNPEHPGGSDDHTSFSLPGIGACTDVGKRHHYNQDSIAISLADDGRKIVVVCDGVSGASDSERASLAGVEAAIAEIRTGLGEGMSAEDASRRGVGAAHSAVAAVGKQYPNSPPSSTYVSAVIEGDQVILCWVGDSQAFWAGEKEAKRLTVDDTIHDRLVYQGVDPSDDRYKNPYAKALLAWLGADAPTLNPNLLRVDLRGGHVVVCSDGLSRYFNDDSDLLPLPEGTVGDKAVALTRQALANGGHDNISVAVVELESPGSVQVDVQEQESADPDPSGPKGAEPAPLLGIASEAEYTELLGGGRP